MDYDAAWSPDGQWIVFTSERDGSADLYSVKSDGTGLERLTDDPAYDDQAAISPDGRQLVYVTTRAGGMPSGMGTSTAAGAVKLDARPSARESHSMIGKASNPLVPAGFRIWVNGLAVLGLRTPLSSRYIGALIWTPVFT